MGIAGDVNYEFTKFLHIPPKCGSCTSICKNILDLTSLD